MDDLQLVDGNCPSDLPFECDFDDANICGFTHDPTEKHRWIRHKGLINSFFFNKFRKSCFLGATPGTLNGPSIDHSTLTSSGTNEFFEILFYFNCF